MGVRNVTALSEFQHGKLSKSIFTTEGRRRVERHVFASYTFLPPSQCGVALEYDLRNILARIAQKYIYLQILTHFLGHISTLLGAFGTPNAWEKGRIYILEINK